MKAVADLELLYCGGKKSQGRIRYAYYIIYITTPLSKIFQTSSSLFQTQTILRIISPFLHISSFSTNTYNGDYTFLPLKSPYLPQQNNERPFNSSTADHYMAVTSPFVLSPPRVFTFPILQSRISPAPS
ncbi:hypothetical protein QVD17_02615 [Tagetes erecta]|uniref:Uncharacterized protein n=1 Tax=Tagetes erecta TaxID=13708 RepID=A0AAD8P9C1_TARER|nr:hypothetical protein QVD17_02615 [Tagetes erecta]